MFRFVYQDSTRKDSKFTNLLSYYFPHYSTIFVSTFLIFIFIVLFLFYNYESQLYSYSYFYSFQKLLYKRENVWSLCLRMRRNILVFKTKQQPNKLAETN